MNEFHPKLPMATGGKSPKEFIRVPASQLCALITMAKQYNEDIRTGLAEGLYDITENFDLASNLLIVQNAESLLTDGVQLIDTDKAIRSVQLQELVGEAVLLNAVPEFCWVAQNACFTRCSNGQIGQWEFILDLNSQLTDIPPLLHLEIQTARDEGISYLLFLQKMASIN